MPEPSESPPAQPDILKEVQRLLSTLEAHPDPAVREQVAALLEGIDAVHRTALTHLVNAIYGIAGEAFMNRLIADPAIRLLFMSYGLLAVDRRLQAEEALDAVRGHLHVRGIDVELRDVVGGVVYVKLHGLEGSDLPEEGINRDLEEALKEGLLGFQELVVRDREAAGTASPLFQIEGLDRPVYRAILAAADLPGGTMKGIDVDGHSLLLANVEGEVYAVRNRCGESPLPLEFGALEGAEIRCPWHGCRYDIRSGKQLDRGDERLAVYPVAVENGEIRVAVGTEPVPAR